VKEKCSQLLKIQYFDFSRIERRAGERNGGERREGAVRDHTPDIKQLSRFKKETLKGSDERERGGEKEGGVKSEFYLTLSPE